MGTRAYLIIRDFKDQIQLYFPMEGYPERIIPSLPKALKYTWPYPLMRISDLAAGIVKIWNTGPGTILICGQKDEFITNIEYLYIIDPGIERWRIAAYKAKFDNKKNPLADQNPFWEGHIGDAYGKE